MTTYITHQKATVIANGKPLPERGEAYPVGDHGAKLGKSYDNCRGRHYYLKYRSEGSVARANAEFNV